MKHNVKVTAILIAMFFIAQLVGIFVSSVYLPETKVVGNETITEYNLPYGVEPPQQQTPGISLLSIIFALIIAVFLLFVLMKFELKIVLRIWFFAVIVLGIGIAINAFLIKIPNSAIIALALAIPLAILKVFNRNLIAHNFTELLIYPGIASVFIPILDLWTIILLLLFISAYDIYAVWHAGFMQKMAKYQIENLKVFSGFFIPYLSKKDKVKIKATKKSKGKKKVAVNLAVLGGGDIVFPIILAGIVLRTLGLYQALIIAVGATIALTYLFSVSQKGKFYPAMPYITSGCLIALGIAYLI